MRQAQSVLTLLMAWGGGVETLDNLWRDGTGLKILHEYFRFSDKEPSFRYPKDYFLH
jgi:hypothetical protein